MDQLKIIGIVGSLREKSFNKGLLRAAVEIKPQEVDIQIWDIKDIPLYNSDLDEDGIRPEPVEKLKSAVTKSDAVLLATPEYHYSVPGVTKNIIDWIGSDPDNVLMGKKIGIMGASTSGFGTVRSQLHLRQVLFAASAKTFQDNELYVSFARKKFDENGDLTDEDTKGKLKEFLAGFLHWLNLNKS